MARSLALAVVGVLGLAGCAGGGDDGGPFGGDERFSKARTGSVALVDETWRCNGPVDMESVSVTIRNADRDAVHLNEGCTGRIGRIEVVQYIRDGVKVKPGVHDLVIEGGSIHCFDRKPIVHQDGVQAMGGRNVTFVGVRIECLTANNSPFFVREGKGRQERPTDILCIRCYLKGGTFTVRINDSLRSGVRDSTICSGRYGAVRVLPAAVEPVNVGNRIGSC